ncbi:hypothetical protein CWI36_0127p0010 [Hamiltosporidium magnivora]|uniref:Uncharacterized protein n=1 Tax=Hamiltosporidium magnivora TaxID=148818 RepID=A0A4Q9LKH9_9MICR|nr:hypothetical protein CWI36_0127p0010 [Hamiltosporidium magnivora]
MDLWIGKLQILMLIFYMSTMLTTNDDKYTVCDFDEQLTHVANFFYVKTKETLKKFADSDFYDVKLQERHLAPEINEAICNFVNSSTSTNFNIFFDSDCKIVRSKKNPDILHLLELRKIGKGNFFFEIKYIDRNNKELCYRQRHIVFGNKFLKHLLKNIFNTTLIFRKFYINLMGGLVSSCRYSHSNYRFIIFDPEISFEHVIGLPNKRLAFYSSKNLIAFKSTVTTKLKLSGKLPVISDAQDLNLILKEKCKIFQQLNQEYSIKACWRCRNIYKEDIDYNTSNLLHSFYSIITFRTDCIKEFSDNCNNDSLSSNLIKNEYFIEYKATYDAPIESLNFRKEIRIDFSLHKKPYVFTLFLKEHTHFEKKFSLNFSLFSSDELFEILSDYNLNVTNIVDKVAKFEKFFYDFPLENSSVYKYEYFVKNLCKELYRRMLMDKLAIIYW